MGKDRKIIRKITFHIYVNNFHDSSSIQGIYEGGEDPFKKCKNVKEAREIFLTTAKKYLEDSFIEYDETIDFVLAKTNKRGQCHFQKFDKRDLSNTYRFIMED